MDERVEVNVYGHGDDPDYVIEGDFPAQVSVGDEIVMRVVRITRKVVER